MEKRKNIKLKKTINKTLKGFTLVELIVVIAIIGVLAAILIPTMMGRVKDAKLKAANDGAAKIAENAAIILTDMDTDGVGMTSMYGNEYGAFDDLSVFEKTDEIEFRDRMYKALPELKNNMWAVSFDENGNVDAVVYWQRGNVMGTHPVIDLSKHTLLADNKLGKDSKFAQYGYQMKIALDEIKKAKKAS